MTSDAPQPAWSWPGLIALVVCASMWSLSGPLIKMLHADGVAGVATLARKAGVPVVALVGSADIALGGPADDLSRLIGLTEIILITPSDMTVEHATPKTHALLRSAASKFICSFQTP